MIICFNTVIISVIYKNKCLHEPMYIFTAALLCNALFGATALYPKLLIDLLSEKQIISFGACLFQAFCIYTYGASEFMLLSVMAYDRYVSICKPLPYASLLKTLESVQIPHIIDMILSVSHSVITPLINPIIYGLKLQEIFNNIRGLISLEKWAQVSF
ncbi:LOW QUALITY PROTEIN: olfactory receptor 10K1-like [Ictalurus furcatus]|uniref:LOW QUALITY PROTEIN: olfactory receptor 10K1-like n=1 Tax=Ictalurus furcatus TaxID=66913 RepID=UPI002350783A|nr:LOW QUALITY PROTEIN: olfactory receptor 10K1-like [Ictalurus furcatus]